MGIKLSDVSPLAGMLTGKGMMGKAMRDGFGGLIPQAIARDSYSDEEERMRLAQAAAMGASPARMKNGGSASARADGIAQRGKTRGKMV